MFSVRVSVSGVSEGERVSAINLPPSIDTIKLYFMVVYALLKTTIPANDDDKVAKREKKTDTFYEMLMMVYADIEESHPIVSFRLRFFFFSFQPHSSNGMAFK